MLDRLRGVVTFDASVYREIAKDEGATGSAVLVLVLVSLAPVLVMSLINRGADLLLAPFHVVGALLAWFLYAVLLAFVARRFFEGEVDTEQMLRVSGYSSVFNLVSFIPVVQVAGVMLFIVGTVLGVREAAEFDALKAGLTVLVTLALGLSLVLALGILVALLGGVALLPRFNSR
ncbi:YIP1 family protein [Anthocerotibacter panamensis]|uniref:YIP1 family protein n=1 Tax=Anthocerotibacter panamensis TaxID=2857077 RepID=UPI001C403874|nr:YIP1 family protein [Anthocerotibacter panamensis]